MAVETTDYQAVVAFLCGEKAAVVPSPEATEVLGDEPRRAEWIPDLDLGLSAAVARSADPGQRLAEYQVFASGGWELEGVMILQPETEYQAEVRAAVAARSERALRDLLLAFPPGKLGFFPVAAEWMLPVLSELIDGHPMPARGGDDATRLTPADLSIAEVHLRPSGDTGCTPPDRVHSFLGIKRGTGPFVDIPADRFYGAVRRMPTPAARRSTCERGEISSSKEPVLVQLRDLAIASGRRARSQFMVEGQTLVQRAISDGLPIDVIVYTPELARAAEGVMLLDQARLRGLRHFQISEGLMGKITSTRPVPPAAAAVYVSFRDAARFRTGPEATLLVTEAVNNPENLGLILRTADAAGVGGVVTIGDKSDPFHKLCVRAARGAVGRIPILACSDPPAYLRRLRSEGFRVIGATARAEANLYGCELKPPLVVVVGNEQTGISPALLEECTERMKIPMAPGQASLNVGVASGVLLYELLRQRLAGMDAANLGFRGVIRE